MNTYFVNRNQALTSSQRPQLRQEEGLELPFPKGRQWVPISSIVLLEGFGNYTQIHFRDGSQLLVALTLKALTERLPNGSFVRPHRKYMFNWQFVRAMHRLESEVVLTNGVHLPIARRRMGRFISEFKQRDRAGKSLANDGQKNSRKHSCDPCQFSPLWA